MTKIRERLSKPSLIFFCRFTGCETLPTQISCLSGVQFQDVVLRCQFIAKGKVCELGNILLAADTGSLVCNIAAGTRNSSIRIHGQDSWFRVAEGRPVQMHTTWPLLLAAATAFFRTPEWSLPKPKWCRQCPLKRFFSSFNPRGAAQL